MAVVSPANQSAIANLYIALFNRAPDAAGFAFWTQALANGASLASITQGFVATPEARAIYTASQSSTDFVAAYYTTVLGRTPDAEGLAFWTKALDAKGGAGSDAARAFVVSQIVETVSTPLPVKPADLTEAEFVLTYGDRYKFINKGVVAVYYADTYKGNDLTLAKQVLTVVDPTTGSIDTAIALLTPSTSTPTPPVVVPPVVVTPMHFIGTDGPDNFVGGAGDDTFEFVIDNNTLANTTLTLKDVITGGAGNDTLTVTTTGAITDTNFHPLGSTISGIETVILKKIAASTVTYVAGSDVTAVVVDGGSGNTRIEDLGQGAKLGLTGTTGGTVTAVYLPAATATTVALTGSVSASSVALQAAGLTSVALTSTGSANALTSLVVSPQVTAINMVVDTALTINSIIGSSPIGVTISGVGTVNLATLTDPSLKTIDATANTGGLTATLSSNNPVIAIKGSSGNDTISTGIALTSGSVNAGDGTGDRLIVTATAALSTPALGAKYTGFEILQVGNGVTVDLTANNLAGISSVEIADGAGSTFVGLATAAQASAITILSANPTGFIGIGVAAGIDTVKASVITTLAGAAQAMDLTGLAVTNIVTKLELTGNGAVGATAGLLTLTTANATTLTSLVVKNEGGASITVGGGHTGDNLSIDASESAGAVTINAASYSRATGVTIKGGSGTNILTGSSSGDTIVGGASNDTINAGVTAVGSGVDTLTGGAGADTFVFSVANNNTAHGGITAVITDFKGGEDKIQFTVATLADATAFQKAGAAVVDLATLLTDADAALNGVVRAYVGQVTGGDTYVVADLGGNGYSEVIKLTGVSLADIGVGDFVLNGPPPPP